MRAISRHGDRTRLGAAVATASPLCSLIGTLQWYQELSAFGRDRAIAKLAGEHERETQRFRRPPQDGAKGGCDANYVRALLWIGHTQSQHCGVRADQREGKDSRRDTAFRDDDGRPAGTGGMAPRERNSARGHGIDGDLLETGVECFGAGGIRVAAGEWARSEGSAWTKDGSERQPMDRGFAQTWVATEQFCAAAGNPGFAGFDADAGHFDARAHVGMQSDSEGVGGCQHQIGIGGERCIRRVWTGDIGCADERRK